MKPTSRVALWCGIVLAFVSSGCQSPKKAATPKEALTNYANSVLKGDQGLFLASTTGLPPEQAKAIFELESEMVAFDKALKAAYGKESGAKSDFSSDARVYEELLKADVKQAGNKATASASGTGSAQANLVKVGEFWFVDLWRDWSLASGDPNDIVKLAKAFSEPIRQAKELIGKEGYSAQRVQSELAAKAWASLISLAITADPDKLGSAMPPLAHLRPGGGTSETASPRPAAGTSDGAPPAASMDGMTAQQKLAYAQAHFASDLRLVKKHPWTRVPAADVQEAVKRVFGIGAADPAAGPAAPAGAVSTGAEVNFVGLSKTQVQSLVGNPSAKASASGEDVWTYAYKGTQLSASLAFRNDKVVRAQAG